MNIRNWWPTLLEFTYIHVLTVLTGLVWVDLYWQFVLLQLLHGLRLHAQLLHFPLLSQGQHLCALADDAMSLPGHPILRKYYSGTRVCIVLDRYTRVFDTYSRDHAALFWKANALRHDHTHSVYTDSRLCVSSFTLVSKLAI